MDSFKTIAGSHDSPRDTADYVVSTIFSTHDSDSIVASLQGVQAKFADVGAQPEVALAWKEKAATAIFEGVLLMLHAPDADKARLNARLADMCAWVRETAPDIFAWGADHIKTHEKEIAMAVACAAAVAVLWFLAPWVLEALGFGFPGLRAGSAAARLMQRYMGRVPKGSWMSFFQRLGAVWGRK